MIKEHIQPDVFDNIITAFNIASNIGLNINYTKMTTSELIESPKIHKTINTLSGFIFDKMGSQLITLLDNITDMPSVECVKYLKRVIAQNSTDKESKMSIGEMYKKSCEYLHMMKDALSLNKSLRDEIFDVYIYLIIRDNSHLSSLIDDIFLASM